MAIAAVDTHEAYKDLKDAGFADSQAEAVVKVMRRSSELPDISGLATNADMKNEFAQVRAEMKLLEATTKGLKGELVWWMIGLIGTGTILQAVASHLAK